MHLNGNFKVNATPQQVWQKITNPGLMAACIPGCESIEQIDAATYQAVVAVGVGVVKAKFNLLVEVVEENPPFEVLSKTSGLEGGRTSTLTAENRVWLTELDDGTRVDYESEVSITGRLGKFGLGIMRKHVEKMSAKFAVNFQSGILEQGSPAEFSAIDEKVESENLATTSGQAYAQNTVEDSTNTSVSTQNALLWPKTVDEAVAVLSNTSGSQPLAGGATLIAMRNAGLINVKQYVSLERVDGIQGITIQPDGSIRIGAMTRHRDTAACENLTGNLVVLRQAAGSIASMPVRNMGTMGGSLANADPAADYLAALTCLDASVEIVGPRGTRSIGINEFITDWYETVLGHGEIITAVILPPSCDGYSSYRKVARVSGDYAVASCAISTSAEKTIRIAIGGCGPSPIRLKHAEFSLGRGNFSDNEIDSYSGQLIRLADPVDDVRGSAEYRRNLIPQLVRDAFAGLEKNRGI